MRAQAIQHAQTRTQGGPDAAPGGVFFWGDIVDAEVVCDLVGFIHQSRRTVVLTVAEGDRRKSVYFRQGAIMAASSCVPEDRFGDILFRRGLITRAQLDEVVAEIKPGRKIGNILMGKGLITAEELWKILKVQIEEILYSILLFDHGEFTVAFYDPSQVPTRTALDTQHVLLEGLRRKDEMRHLRDELPAADVLLVPQKGPDLRLENNERNMLALIDGRRTVQQLLSDSGLGQFAATRALHRLVKAGLVRQCALGAEETTMRPWVILEAFNNAFSSIGDALALTPAAATVKSGFDSFFADASAELKSLFVDVSADESGRIDASTVVRNYLTVPAENKDQLLSWGLRDYLRFLLFTAREWLPYEQVETLAAAVSQAVDGY